MKSSRHLLPRRPAQNSLRLAWEPAEDKNREFGCIATVPLIGNRCTGFGVNASYPYTVANFKTFYTLTNFGDYSILS